MKYGAHCYLFTERWQDNRLHLMDRAAELGLGMFELSIGDDVDFTPSLTRARAEALGMDLAIGPGGVWPMENDLSAGDPADRAKGLAWHKKQVDLAAELGAIAYAGALYAHPGVIQRRVPPADEYAWTAEGLHTLAEYAHERSVIIALEPMSHFRTHMVNTPAQMMRLIEMADHDNLTVLFDTYHVATEIRDYGEGIRTVAPRLWCLHACENDRGAPGGGIVPWDDIFAALAETGFDGYITLETYNSGIGDFSFRRGMFHNVCPDGAEFVKKSLSFLQGMATKYGMTRDE